MSAVPVTPGAAGLRQPARSAAMSGVWLRAVTFTVLALYATAHWAWLLRPGGAGTMTLMLAVAVAGALTVRWAARRPGLIGRAAAAGAVVASLALILLAAGVPWSLLRPDHWGSLIAGLGRGLEALPELRVPYRGNDPWVRTVILGGGGLLVLLAALPALAGTRPRTFATAVVLGAMSVVPMVERSPRSPYLDGALLTVALAAWLWHDRLAGAELPPAAVLVLGAVLAGALIAPRLDASAPWIDYEALSEALQAGPSREFRWNHTYGPITWTRDGVELARVRARGDVYLKTANLDRFDGRVWREAEDPGPRDTQFAGGHPSWRQHIHVTIRGLRSAQFLGAGTTLRIWHSTKPIRQVSPGTFATAAADLRRGDSYDAEVYVPKPTVVAMRTDDTRYPPYVIPDLQVTVPAKIGEPGEPAVPVTISPAPWGSGLSAAAQSAAGYPFLDPDRTLRASRYAGAYGLARQLAAASTDPYDFVEQVIARVQRGARYTESPPPPKPGREPLESFLFDTHAGYCQHFAGATALLLRLGGVPARVVAGFSPGARDGNERVIRDLDAHSWVEVYFPHLGWVTFDPTPGDSPARSQLTDTVRAGSRPPGSVRIPTPGGDRTSDPRAGGKAAGGAAADGGGGGPLLGVGIGLAAVALAAAALLGRRRRTQLGPDPQLGELLLALRQTGRPTPPDLTLARLEQQLAGSEVARGYVRALRLARYGGRAAQPTAAQRRALRRELAHGLGLRARLGALWALPIRVSEVGDALRPRRRQSYTEPA